MRLLEYILDCLYFLWTFIYLFGFVPSLTVWHFIQCCGLDLEIGQRYHILEIFIILGWTFLWVLFLALEVYFIYIAAPFIVDPQRAKETLLKYW